MNHIRHDLPRIGGDIFLTDGGLETTLIFHAGLDMPHFAAFHLLRDPEGRDAVERYYRRHAAIAEQRGTGFIFESATWRASRDWGDLLGYSRDELAIANYQAVDLMRQVHAEFPGLRAVISGCVGPRGDGYDPGEAMTDLEAMQYHGEQIATFAKSGAQMIAAITMTNVPEATGVALAAQAVGLPAAISFTVETDGRLPTGDGLGEAIEAVDAATRGWPAYFMINCAHPDHFRDTLAAGGDWLQRIGGIRANASRMSHAELDEAEELDDGDPHELGQDYAELRRLLPHLAVLGGCCGTDHRHVEQIGHNCVHSHA